MRRFTIGLIHGWVAQASLLGGIRQFQPFTGRAGVQHQVFSFANGEFQLEEHVLQQQNIQLAVAGFSGLL